MSDLAILGGRAIRRRAFPRSPVLGDEERKEVEDVLKSGLLSGFLASPGEQFFGGPKVLKLEEEFKAYFKARYAIALNSATAGLHAAVAACGIGPGDEVIVTPYTMTASASAILMANAVPVFADIEEDHFCLDPDSVERAITKNTKAILIVHLFGMAADMDAIMRLGRKHRLFVIEDCAQSPAAYYKRKLTGRFGDIGIFSFNQNKTITTGEGGVIITNNKNLARRCQLIRNHGEVLVESMDVDKIDNMLGWNYRLTELEAGIGIAQFGKLNELTEYRVKLAEYLCDRLSDIPGLVMPKIRKGCNHVYFMVPMRYDEKKIGLPRDIFAKAIRAEGVPLGAGYVRPIYLEPLYRKKICYGKKGCPFTCGYYKKRISYKKGLCPVAERMHFKELITINLCRYPVTKRDMDDIVRAFKKVIANKKELLSGKNMRKIRRTK